jgi:hypothetical protein
MAGRERETHRPCVCNKGSRQPLDTSRLFPTTSMVFLRDDLRTTDRYQEDQISSQDVSCLDQCVERFSRRQCSSESEFDRHSWLEAQYFDTHPTTRHNGRETNLFGCLSGVKTSLLGPAYSLVIIALGSDIGLCKIRLQHAFCYGYMIYVHIHARPPALPMLPSYGARQRKLSAPPTRANFRPPSDCP